MNGDQVYDFFLQYCAGKQSFPELMAVTRTLALVAAIQQERPELLEKLNSEVVTNEPHWGNIVAQVKRVLGEKENV